MCQGWFLWVLGKDSSPRWWLGTGTGSPGKQSQHQACWSSRSVWTMLSGSWCILGAVLCRASVILVGPAQDIPWFCSRYCAHFSPPCSGWKKLCLKRPYLSVLYLTAEWKKLNFISQTGLSILYSMFLAKHTMEISSGIHWEIPPLAWKYSTF